MPEHSQFVSKWPEHPIGTKCFYCPEHLEDKTPHPEIMPQVLDIVARMFVPRPIINGDSKSTPFPKLPIELCRMIWLKSLPSPRIIEVQRWFGDEYDFCSSDCPIPAALPVNREAHEVALEFCKPWFAILGAPAEIYFDKEIDWGICFKKTFVGKARRQLVGLTARRFL
ncbi:hypothetical protein F5882DRAFT_461416 [Hyaloscypha sp. PMI_1271]|nr:hypothetical protein F5882DRAFT_461416 [Hyaloscypha sp. PMI_1271]